MSSLNSILDYLPALRAGVLAAQEIMRFYTAEIAVDEKGDGSPVTAADRASSAVIQRELALYGLPIIDEEVQQASYEERQSWSSCWCVDPLDGTKEFIAKNDEFAVNIAHIVNGHPVMGIIVSPCQERLVFGGAHVGVFVATFRSWEYPEQWENVLVDDPSAESLTLIGSRSHHSGTTLSYIHSLQERGIELHFLKKGSALKFFDLAEGKAQLYPRFAPTMEWDIAAGHALLLGLGGNVLHAYDKTPLVYNKANLQNPYFIAHTKHVQP